MKKTNKELNYYDERRWPMIRIKDFCIIVTPPKKIQATNFFSKGLYPIIDQSQNKIAGWTNDKNSIININQPVVVFGDHTCVVKYVNQPFAQGADGIKILKTTTGLLPRFLYFFLQYKPIHIDGYKRHFSKLKEHKIPLPPLSEQKKIVKILSTWDKAIEKLDKLILAKEKQFKWLLKKLITDQQDKPNWKKVKLAEVCKIFNGSTPLKNKKSYWKNGTIPWFTIEDIRNQGRNIIKTKQKITKEALKNTSVKLLPKKTVLLCCTASVGEYAISEIELTTNQQFNGLVVNKKYKKNLLPEFLFQISSTFKEKLLQLSGKTSFSFVPVKNLKKMKIPILPIEEQKKIVKTLSTKNQELETLKQLYKKYEEQKQGLMQKLLTGKWRMVYRSGLKIDEKSRMRVLVEKI